MKPFDAVIPAPFGALGVRLQGDVVGSIEFLDPRPAMKPPSGLARRSFDELAAYLSDAAHLPHLPLADAGTPFQRRVWGRLRAIPRGDAISYGALAQELGTSARAIGGACAANPLVIVVPCHRVISAAGLGGFMGAAAGRTVEIKRWLLAHEATL